MGQSFLTGDTTNVYEDSLNTSSVTDTDLSSTVASDKVIYEVTMSTNNYPLCKLTDDCQEFTIPEEVDTTLIENPTLLSRQFKITFESIYENLASFRSETNTSDRRYLIRKDYLPDDKVITIITDMRTSGSIVTKITGDTGYDFTLVKTTTHVKGVKIDVVYSTE